MVLPCFGQFLQSYQVISRLRFEMVLITFGFFNIAYHVFFFLQGNMFLLFEHQYQVYLTLYYGNNVFEQWQWLVF